ncbi:hypothetical protein [Acinetobacter baumannii]|uniref:hypothetical protein n=4 Tax=Acinetobacter baumannii TaxID=470 RepID=UPI0005F8AB7E|nr:hypothetical protein [Acinetobacter baumannii]AYY89943.1 hypothetical protein EGM95_14655 [Acinetobacter baumannii]KAF0597310.1 hypothetical protein AB71190_03912 [Acinetobacter baumannii]KAF0626897.1 hypothetical protein AB71189_03920 [Acinetobacter baumannii]KAF0628060.1 hypothetical protein AB71191_03910 [Acinetobacter baumannii]KJX74328.1 hypothetical protein WH42_00530 [Acinetobacter baumannii]
MKPEQFIREYGLDKAREVVESIPSKYMECYYSTLCYCTKAKKYSDRFNPRIELVNMADLKLLVESLEIIETVGYDRDGAEEIYEFSKDCRVIHYAGLEIKVARLAQAIRDHESIYGGGDE